MDRYGKDKKPGRTPQQIFAAVIAIVLCASLILSLVAGLLAY